MQLSKLLWIDRNRNIRIQSMRASRSEVGASARLHGLLAGCCSGRVAWRCGVHRQSGHGTASAFHDAHVAALGDRRLVHLGPSTTTTSACSRSRPVGNLGHGEDRAQNGVGD